MSEHWTDTQFRKLIGQGFAYGYLAHSGRTSDETPSSAFKGYNTLSELFAENAKLELFDDCTIFYAVSVERLSYSRINPPQHHLMAYIFPKEGSKSKPQWWVLGYVVELNLYKELEL